MIDDLATLHQNLLTGALATTHPPAAGFSFIVNWLCLCNIPPFYDVILSRIVLCSMKASSNPTYVAVKS